MAACLPVAAVILAAGSGTRMGKLKQLLPYRGGTLIQHAVDQAIEAEFDPIIVVVGAECESVRGCLASRCVQLVFNSNWQLGMGSSLSAGVLKLQQDGIDSAAVAILLGDQPLVTAGHLKLMRNCLHASPAGAVAAQYNGTLGVPALFKRHLFSALTELPPEAGARYLLRQPGIQVDAFALPEAGVDIDTPDDYANLGL